jgi:hypothetical protein
MLDWIKARVKERTSLDGVALVAICGGFLLFDGLAVMAAWAGLLYGVWTIIQAEK